MNFEFVVYFYILKVYVLKLLYCNYYAFHMQVGEYLFAEDCYEENFVG